MFALMIDTINSSHDISNDNLRTISLLTPTAACGNVLANKNAYYDFWAEEFRNGKNPTTRAPIDGHVLLCLFSLSHYFHS